MHAHGPSGKWLKKEAANFPPSLHEKKNMITWHFPPDSKMLSKKMQLLGLGWRVTPVITASPWELSKQTAWLEWEIIPLLILYRSHSSEFHSKFAFPDQNGPSFSNATDNGRKKEDCLMIIALLEQLECQIESFLLLKSWWVSILLPMVNLPPLICCKFPLLRHLCSDLFSRSLHICSGWKHYFNGSLQSLLETMHELDD